MKNRTTRQLVTDAMLSAVCAVLGALAPVFPNLKITFEGLPVIVGALLFGPIDGFLIGGIGTLLYQLLLYGVTATTALWILPYMLAGLLAGGIARRHTFVLERRTMAAAVFGGEGLIFALNTVALYVDSRIYGYYTPALIFGSLPVRALICAAKAVAYTAVLPALLGALKGGKRE